MELTHDYICDRAVKWLLNMGCSIAVKEITCWATQERPDAIGFIDGFGAVVEVKTSRADYLRDAKKPHRAKGMGAYRYFMTPPNLLKPEELPDGWGLVEVHGKICRVIKGDKKFNPFMFEPRFSPDDRAEKGLLVSLVRRLRDGEQTAQRIATKKFACPPLQTTNEKCEK